MDVKDFKNIDEQLNIMKKHGCTIENNKFAYNVLKNMSYYRLSSYFIPFKDERGMFLPETTFDKIYNNYSFDHRLRNLVIALIEKIELKMKCKISYYHAEKYGPLGYLSEKCFNDKFDKEYLENRISKCVARNNNNPIIIHHKEKYGGKFPFWVIIEFFDFTDVSKLFSELDTETQKAIAKSMNLNYRCVASWLYCLCNLRNCCAHFSRIYNKRMVAKPRNMKEYKGNLDEKLYSYLLLMKFLLNSSNDWSNFVNELEKIIVIYGQDIDIKFMGFPSAWKRALNSKTKLVGN